MRHDFFIRCDSRYIRIDTGSIRYMESLKNYVRIVTTDKAWLVLMSLKQLEKELPENQFCRIHRSYIVSLSHIQSFDKDAVYLGDKIIPINPVYRSVLQSKVRVLISETRSRCGGSDVIL